MSRVLGFCWREWRAQRAALAAFTALGLAVLALALTAVRADWWLTERRGAFALSWFVALGVAGVLAFAAPALVRSERGARGEQFVQRLPGALGASFAGKLLFLLLAGAALPALCLLAGELVLTALGQGWDDLFTWSADGQVWPVWPWPLRVAGWAALLVPWVWAVGAWLPAGRMALGGTVLLALGAGIVVTAVLRQHPRLEAGIAWQAWIPYLPALGLVVAAVSWLARRGGPLGSARAGVVAAALGFAPPVVWLAGEVHRYHHPDPSRLGALSVYGITTDSRFAMVRAAEHEGWNGASFRVDLGTGTADELPEGSYSRESLRRWPFEWMGSRRFWRSASRDRHTLLDLVTGASTVLGLDASTREPRWPAELRVRIVADLLACSPLCGPGGQRWLVVDGEVLAGQPGGIVDRRPWPGPDGALQPAGHGAKLLGPREGHYLDRNGQRVGDVTAGSWAAAFAVRDRWLFVRRPASPGLGGWQQREPDGAAAPVEALRDAGVLGLANDDEVLCLVPATPQRDARLFLYRPADRAVAPLALPAGFVVQHAEPEPRDAARASLLPRDPSGRIWLSCWLAPALRRLTRRDGDGILWVDPAARTVERCPWRLEGSWRRLLAWPDERSVLAQEDARIVRIDLATGARTVLFPR